ncbi:MAG: hypothetical protein U9R57_15715 [Thermodesulfobacteriota bacterium]|nr:hypothetical protein [Thermodesulfobacteriota bacterium]
MNRIKLVLIGIVLFLCSVTLASAGQDLVDIEGEEWVSTITAQSSRCKSIGKNIASTHTYVILARTDEKVVVVHRKSGISYYGRVDKENPMIIHYWASYLKDAGVVTERLKFEKSDNNSGKGRSVWNWSDGIMSCGGEYSFTAVRVEK